MKKLPFISLFLVSILLCSGAASAQIIKELPQKQELENFTATVTENAWSVNIASMEAISDHPTWPHDIWEDTKGNNYISFYYLNNNTSKGYSSIYFDDYGNRLPSNCRLTLKLVDPYYGLNVTENTTDPVEIIEPNETDNHGYEAPDNPQEVEVYDNTFVNTGNQTGNNITVIKASGNQSVGDNSTGTVINQGKIDKMIQYCLDFSNAHLSNVSFNFWGN